MESCQEVCISYAGRGLDLHYLPVLNKATGQSDMFPLLHGLCLLPHGFQTLPGTLWCHSPSINQWPGSVTTAQQWSMSVTL